MGPAIINRFPITGGARWARLAAAAALILTAASARAESQHCAELRAHLARASADNAGARYQAAAAKQRGEYARLAARGHALGCDRGQFLFFGDPPPAQCGQVNARLSQLAGSIAAYERAGADDGGQRQALSARYDAECRNPQYMEARAPRPRNFFEELFGLASPDGSTGLREIPVGPPDAESEFGPSDGRPRGGPEAICVRACDGGFFPVSYSARSSNLDELASLCNALCPNAEVKLYTQSQSKGLSSALSIDGEAYSDHPNALKFQKSYDPSCGCKPPGQSWAEALAEAERIIAERNAKDQVVTAEQAEQLSRPFGPNDPRLKKQKAAAPAAPPVPETEPASKPPLAVDGAGETPESYREVIGPDGVKRRVRVVAPML